MLSRPRPPHADGGRRGRVGGDGGGGSAGDGGGGSGGDGGGGVLYLVCIQLSSPDRLHRLLLLSTPSTVTGTSVQRGRVLEQQQQQNQNQNQNPLLSREMSLPQQQGRIMTINNKINKEFIQR